MSAGPQPASLANHFLQNIDALDVSADGAQFHDFSVDENRRIHASESALGRSCDGPSRARKARNESLFLLIVIIFFCLLPFVFFFFFGWRMQSGGTGADNAPWRSGLPKKREKERREKCLLISSENLNQIILTHQRGSK